MWYWYLLRQWWRGLRNPPVVIIQKFGQLTPRPQVVVSVAGMNGSQTVYVYDDTDQGNAAATLYGKGLAETMQRRCIDLRGAP